MSVYAFTITRADTPTRAQLLLKTMTSARDMAGVDFHWDVFCCGAPQAEDICASAVKIGLINNVISKRDNVGQHVCMNEAIERAKDYTYLLRLDDDVDFKTRRWLMKLVRASVLLEDKFIISPLVRGLKNPPSTSTVCSVNGVDLVFLLDAIGGICRLHPMHLLTMEGKEYVSDVRLPMGAGDAVGIAAWAKENLVPLAYICNVTVRHALGTTGQEYADPAYFKEHGVFQAMPYIPTWHGGVV